MRGLVYFQNLYEANKKTILTHSIGWFSYFLYFYFALILSYPDDKIHIVSIIIRFLSFITIFYTISKLSLPLLIEKHKPFQSFLFLLLGLGVAQICYYFNFWLVQAFYNEAMSAYIANPVRFFFINLYEYIQFIIAGCANWFYLYSIKQKNEKLKLQEQYHQTEMSFLRSQINQHFLYNVLSLFYTNALPYSERLANSILSLSDIMRYSVSKQYDAFVLLEEEMQNIHTLIAINQYRFNDKLNINLSVEGSTKDIWVPYFSLITLVENAFKHGDLQSDTLSFFITINDNNIFVFSKNRKSYISNNSTKIGLNNLRKRLQLLLPNQFTLTIIEDEKYFTTELQLKNKF